MMARRDHIHIVQLPFPSLSAPHPDVVDYYRDYGRVFSEVASDYFVPEGGLWELPLWVAHLAGMLKSVGYVPRFSDLSTTPPQIDACAAELLAQTRVGDALLFSPLAQNLDLAVAVSRQLMTCGRVTLLGGNMTPLVADGDATIVHHGHVTPQGLEAALAGRHPPMVHPLKRGEVASWRPSYDLLDGYRGKVPLLRLNASHGCLYACDFCGDAWSRRLVLVEADVLECEVTQFEQRFPEIGLIYIGDKTFGQSPEAVRNLLKVFAGRDRFRFIVQTHILALDDDLIGAMERLGVVVVELGFESASTSLLRENHKPHLQLPVLADRIARLTERGIRVVLNVLSGLPGETREDHCRTLDVISDRRTGAWLYNLYNFVPYPLAPQFARLRDRIVDWTYAHWREDGPPVFVPDHVTREQSFQFFLEKVACAHDAVLRSRPVGAGAVAGDRRLM